MIWLMEGVYCRYEREKKIAQGIWKSLKQREKGIVEHGQQIGHGNERSKNRQIEKRQGRGGK